jgi:hypothetical protein
MTNLFFTGVFALLLVLVAHVGLKLYVFEEFHMENLNFGNGGVLDNINNRNIYNKNTNNNDSPLQSQNKNLWNELTRNNTNSHQPKSYGPAVAKTQHAYQGKRGNFNGVVPNYPVLATENEVRDLQESLKKDLAGFLDEHSLDDHLLETKNNNEHTQPLMNAPTGGPVVGRPTKQPYKEIPIGVEEITYDGKFKSYENVMYGSDVETYNKNDSVNPYTNDARYYAPFDKSPIIGC